ncbi:hypothetical protein NIES3275_59930 [Microchaete diplosiphon NIES-3275]|nr:hypothetical protein NIES3275_59930 [Microchaete diplosiphon NIES-3275]
MKNNRLVKPAYFIGHLLFFVCQESRVKSQESRVKGRESKVKGEIQLPITNYQLPIFLLKYLPLSENLDNYSVSGKICTLPSGLSTALSLTFLPYLLAETKGVPIFGIPALST